jgi:hypothetical protein
MSTPPAAAVLRGTALACSPTDRRRRHRLRRSSFCRVAHSGGVCRSVLAAVSKIKEELMLMGFISLMLLACEDQITYFCIPDAVAQWITCDKDDPSATCGPNDVTAVFGTPCCTLGDYYWSHLYESSIKEPHRRMQNASTEELMLVQAADMMGEAYSHRRLGAVNLHNSLLRTTCPSKKYTLDVGSYGDPLMPPAVHPFDCPANGLKAFTHLPGDNGNYDEVMDPNTGHRSGLQGGNKNEVGGFTSNSFMDPQALHHVHTLIFLTACFHVFFTVCEWLDLPSHPTSCVRAARRPPRFHGPWFWVLPDTADECCSQWL